MPFWLEMALRSYFVSKSLKGGIKMKRFIKTKDNELINLDHVTRMHIGEAEANEWIIYLETEKGAYEFASFETEQKALDALSSLIHY